MPVDNGRIHKSPQITVFIVSFSFKATKKRKNLGC